MDTQVKSDFDPQYPPLYRDIVEHSGDAVVIAGADRRIQHLNLTAEALFGHRSSAIRGQGLSTLLSGGRGDSDADPIDRLMNPKRSAMFVESRDGSLRGIHANGTQFPVSLSLLKSGTEKQPYYVAMFRDLSRLRELEEELASVSGTDPVTGIPDRRSFLKRAAQECLRCDRYDRPVCLAMISIDQYTDLVARHGQAAGDRAVRHVTDILIAALRQSDVLARWDHEKIAVLLPETDDVGAHITGERLGATIKKTPLKSEDADGKPVRLTVSVGLTELHRPDETIDGLVERATKALEEAVDDGGNTVNSVRN